MNSRRIRVTSEARVGSRVMLAASNGEPGEAEHTAGIAYGAQRGTVQIEALFSHDLS